METQTPADVLRFGTAARAGSGQIEVGLEKVDRYQIALDKALGVRGLGHKDIQEFYNVQAAYKEITEDFRFQFNIIPRQVTAQEALVATDFPNLLGRSMNRRVVQDFRDMNFHENIFISHRGGTDNFAQQRAVNLLGYEDPPVIDPESEDYSEGGKPLEESASYPLRTVGGLMSVSEMVLRGDDFGGLRRMLLGRTRAHRRAFARFIWSFYTENATFQGDGVPWFAAGHGNLFTAALSPGAIQDAMTAIWEMVEPGSGEEIGGFGHDQGLGFKLIVGRNLWFTAKTINERPYVDANFTPNPVWRQFGENNERIFVSPMPADADNWGIVSDVGDREIIEVKFLDGREEPAIGLTSLEEARRFGLHDKIVYKIKWSYGGVLVDYRNAAKSLVP